MGEEVPCAEGRLNLLVLNFQVLPGRKPELTPMPQSLRLQSPQGRTAGKRTGLEDITDQKVFQEAHRPQPVATGVMELCYQLADPGRLDYKHPQARLAEQIDWQRVRKAIGGKDIQAVNFRQQPGRGFPLVAIGTSLSDRGGQQRMPR